MNYIVTMSDLQMRTSRASIKNSITKGLESSNNYSSDSDSGSNNNPTFKELSSRNSIDNLSQFTSDPVQIPINPMTQGKSRVHQLLLTRQDFPTPEERIIGIWDKLYGK